MKRKMIFLLAAMMVATVGYAQRPHQRSLQSEQAKVVKKAKLATEVNVAGAITTGQGLSADEETTDEYAVRGYVVNAQDFSQTYGAQTFYLADDATNSGNQTFQAFKSIVKDSDGNFKKVCNGDLVVVTGKIKNYKGTTLEIEGGSVEFVTTTSDDHSVSVTLQMINASTAISTAQGLGKGKTSTATYFIEGYVSYIKSTSYSGVYDVWITDTYTGNGEQTNADGAFLMYHVDASALGEGDHVFGRTRLKNYSGTTMESETGAPVLLPVEYSFDNADLIQWMYYPTDNDWYITAENSSQQVAIDVIDKGSHQPFGSFNSEDSEFLLEYTGVFGTDYVYAASAKAEVLYDDITDEFQADITIYGQDLNVYHAVMTRTWPTANSYITTSATNLSVTDHTSDGYWQFSADDGSHGFEFQIYNTSSYLGAYDINDGVLVFINNNTFAISGSIEVTENTDGILLTGNFLGADNVGYKVTLKNYVSNTTVYFVNTQGWASPNAYVWDAGGNEVAGWPGEAMTKTTDQVFGYDVYSYTFPDNYGNIIFNFGTEQTADLVWDPYRPCYYLANEKWYTSPADVHPTVEDLAWIGYDINYDVVLCIHPIGDADVCNNIFLVGSFSGWNSNFYGCPQFTELAAFPGWYATSQFYESNFSAKPIQAKDAADSFSWELQCGNAGAWNYIDGKVADIADDPNLADEATVAFGEAGAYIYELSYWKNHKSCAPKPTHEYTIQLYPPVCSENAYGPAITGEFNNWAETLPMTEKNSGEYYEYYIETSEDERVHFYEAYDGTWSNWLEYYDDISGEWKSDFYLPVVTDAAYTWKLDCSDASKFRWSKCETYTVAVGLLPPPGTPAAGIDIIGTFDSWTGTKMNEDAGSYYIILNGIKKNDFFKFREAGDDAWKNEPMFWDNIIGDWSEFGDMKFSDYWADGTGIYAGYKYIGFDMSDENMYKWKKKPLPEPICYYELVLTDMYNDGWDGGGQMLVKDGDYEEYFRCEYGESPTRVTVPYYGNEVTFSWVDGSCTGENSITVLASNGIGLFYHPEYQEMSAGELLYTMQISPCSSAPNPYNPQNLQATLTNDYALYISWDAVSDAAGYRITVTGPQGVITSSTFITEPSYVTQTLKANGDYQILVVSVDGDYMQIGEASLTKNIVLPNIETATIRVLISSDSNIDVSDGLWLVWGVPGEDADTVKMETTDGHIFSKTITPNAPAYRHFVMNKAHINDPNVLTSGTYNNVQVTEHCSYASYRYDGNTYFSRYGVSDCELADHDYRVSNLQATSAAGAVTFTWDAKDRAQTYYLYIYDASDDSELAVLTLNDLSANSYVWGVSDAYDSKEIYWSLQANQPYQLPAEGASTTITLHKSTVSFVSLTASTSDDKTIDMEWEFSETNLHYLVEITTYGGALVKRDYVIATEYHYVAPYYDGYYCYVTPLSLDDEVVGERQMASTYVATSEAPNPITDVTGTADEHHLTFTWNQTSSIAKAHIELYRQLSNGGWTMITSDESDKKTWSYDVDADGVYAFEIQPMVEYENGKFTVLDWWGEAFATAFSGKTYHVQITTEEGGELWPGSIDGEYAEGFILSISVYASTGYVFEKWSDGVTSRDRNIYISQDTSIVAIFKPLVILTVTVNDPSFGEVDVNNYYETIDAGVYGFISGREARLEAIPATNYEFVEWSDHVKTINRTITMTENTSLEAIFDVLDTSKPQHHVNIYSGDPSMGTVNGCDDDFYEGYTFEVTATPYNGYKFVEWSDHNTDNPREVTVETANIEFYAEFELVTYTLKLEAGEGGTVDPSTEITGITYGEKKVIKAIPNSGYEFVKWSDGNPLFERQITIVQDCTLLASFQKEVVSYTFSLTQTTGGTIASDPVAGTYAENTSIEVTATPNTGWHFVKWSNESTTNPLQFLLTEDVTISAVFEEDGATQYTFALTQTTGGTISSTPAPGTYDAGTSVEVTATPESGYKFVKWSNNSTANPLIFTLTADVTISAVFQEEGAAPSNYSIAWSVEGLGEIEADKEAGTYIEGTVITLTAKPATDWELSEWEINGVASGKTNPLTITLTENTTVVAKFTTNKKYTVTIKAGKNGSVAVEPKISGISSGALVLGGTSLKITATPDEDYRFVAWKEDGNTDEERTIIITQDTTLTAEFEEIPYYRLTVEVDPEEGGTVLFDGKTVSKMYKEYAEGTIVKLTAQAEDGYEFVQFEDGKDEITTEEYKVKVDKKKTVYAIFKKKQQGLDDVNASERVTKVLINGEIYILRGEKVYTVQGQVVK